MRRIILGLAGSLIFFLGGVHAAPAAAQESQGFGGLSTTVAKLDQPVFLFVLYCGKLAGVMWFGPGVMPGLVRVEQLSDPHVMKISARAYTAAKRDGVVYRQDTGKLRECPEI